MYNGVKGKCMDRNKIGKRAYGQVGFQKQYNIIVHLVALRVLIEEKRLRGKESYCSFIDFNQAFNMVYHVKHL